MDEFGVLTERFGLKPQGKSAPMAASKRSLNPNNGQTSHFGSSAGINAKPTSNGSWNTESGNGSLFDGDDIFFSSSSTDRKGMNSVGVDDFDVFGGLNKLSSSKSSGSNPSFGDDLLYSNLGNPGTKTTSSMNSYDVDDIFGGMARSKSSPNVENDGIFGSFSSSAKQKDDVNDLLGDFGQFGPKSRSWNKNSSGDVGKSTTESVALIPGFGESVQPSTGGTTKLATAADDPFVVLESTSSSLNSSSSFFVDPLEEFANSISSKGTKPSNSSQTSTKLKPPPKPTQKVYGGKSSEAFSIDDLEEFAMGRVRRGSSASQNASKYKEAEDIGTKKQQTSVDDLDSFFSSGPRASSVPKSRSTTETMSKQVSNTEKKASKGVSSSVKKPAGPTNLVDDFSTLFGADPLFGEFEDIPGESEERRKARWDRECRTKNRVEQAVADMNRRDRQAQLEQEEKSRIAENLDAEIKRWAAGKEGNMRALLSSLQIVLWPECGWEAVSLTDLITSTAVKKVYRKATLYVHPDKVQQKGATLEQKYIAEKIFDILKEAWNKFNREELS